MTNAASRNPSSTSPRLSDDLLSRFDSRSRMHQRGVRLQGRLGIGDWFENFVLDLDQFGSSPREALRLSATTPAITSPVQRVTSPIPRT